MENNIYSSDFSDKQFKAAYWYARHRLGLRRAMILALAGVALFFLIYGLYGVFDFYVISRSDLALWQKSISDSKLNNELVSQVRSPLQLELQGASVLANNEKDDFVAWVFNPNREWLAQEITYHFKSNSVETPKIKDFVLPGQQKILYAFANEKNSGANLALVIDDIQWKKVANYEALRDKILQFEFLNKKLELGSGQSGEQSYTSLSFELANRSAYSFYDPKFILLVYQGQRLIYSDQIILDSLVAGEVKAKNLLVPMRLPFNSTFTVYPDIDIYDPSVFKGFDVGSGELK